MTEGGDTVTDTRLIERWLPIAALGVESVFVNGRPYASAFPATNYRLHVWWARRPLVASRAAVLASLLPEDADREKFLHVLGIHGDPVATNGELMLPEGEDNVRGTGITAITRAFSYVPDLDDKNWLIHAWALFGQPHCSRSNCWRRQYSHLRQLG